MDSFDMSDKKKTIIATTWEYLLETWEENYIIDPGSPACPYISCYNGESCAYYILWKRKIKNIAF